MNEHLLHLLTNLMKFFARTDARDKLIKFLQNFARYKKYYSSSNDAKKWKALQNSLSEFRSLVKFGKPFKNIVECNELLTTSTSSGGGPSLGFVECLKLFSLCSDIGYKIGDNIEYLSHYQLLSFNELKCESWSKTFQWYAYACDVITGLHDILSLRRDQFKTNEEYVDKRYYMLLYWSGDVADFFRVTPGKEIYKIFVLATSTKYLLLSILHILYMLTFSWTLFFVSFFYKTNIIRFFTNVRRMDEKE